MREYVIKPLSRDQYLVLAIRKVFNVKAIRLKSVR